MEPFPSAAADPLWRTSAGPFHSAPPGFWNGLEMNVDSGFARRVIRTTLWFAPLVIGAAAARGFPWQVVAGLAMGAGVSLLSLISLQWAVERVTASRKGASLLTGLLLLKLPVLGALFYFTLLRYRVVNPAGLIIGLSIPYLVIVLKLAGRALTFGKPSSVHQAEK